MPNVNFYDGGIEIQRNVKDDASAAYALLYRWWELIDELGDPAFPAQDQQKAELRDALSAIKQVILSNSTEEN